MSSEQVIQAFHSLLVEIARVTPDVKSSPDLLFKLTCFKPPHLANSPELSLADTVSICEPTMPSAEHALLQSLVVVPTSKNSALFLHLQRLETFLEHPLDPLSHLVVATFLHRLCKVAQNSVTMNIKTAKLYDFY